MDLIWGWCGLTDDFFTNGFGGVTFALGRFKKVYQGVCAVWSFLGYEILIFHFRLVCWFHHLWSNFSWMEEALNVFTYINFMLIHINVIFLHMSILFCIFVPSKKKI